MKDFSPSVVPVVKGDTFNLDQFPKNDFEKEQMKNIPYVFTIGSLMYAHVYIRPDFAYIAGMLGRYQSNPDMDNWKAAKKVMRHHQGTKDCMLMFNRIENFKVIDYSDLDFSCCNDSRKSTS
ncbi:secreted RxLR effector protein 161-like [Primulina huaijiensis]|uniref:secreted RxLR effector protein 161-like n=1 Tax=Primulina huaijiensis TaxID=1492673 RepID=UPI003CC75001